MDINGTELGEILEGTELADVIRGRQGDDTLYGRQGDDLLYGNRGDDTLYGNRGADTLVGGLGQDTLVGGLGADTFVVDFTVDTVAGGSSSFSGWLQENGKAALQDGVTTQGEFASSYSQWLSSLVQQYHLGADVDGDGTVSVDINQNSDDGPMIEGVSAEQLDAWFGDAQSLTVKTGRTTHERFYVDSFQLPDATTIDSQAGADVVQDFNVDQGDKLALDGITAAQFDANFTVTETDVGADGTMDTVITLNGNEDWSVTLTGVTGFDAAQSVSFA